MRRKSFLKVCALQCLAGSALLTSLQNCSSTQSIAVTHSDNQLTVPISAFAIEKNGDIKYKHVIVVRHEKLDFPVAIYRTNTTDYRAFMLRCTHQGSELNVYGDLISCSAHGSEFDNMGNVMQGPAEQRLKQYAVRATSDNLYIPLT